MLEKLKLYLYPVLVFPGHLVRLWLLSQLHHLHTAQQAAG